jgi:hypothetical protein
LYGWEDSIQIGRIDHGRFSAYVSYYTSRSEPIHHGDMQLVFQLDETSGEWLVRFASHYHHVISVPHNIREWQPATQPSFTPPFEITTPNAIDHGIIELFELHGFMNIDVDVYEWVFE